MRAQRHPGSEGEWNYSPIVWVKTLYSPKTLPNLEKHYIYWSSVAPYKHPYSDPDKPCGHSSGALLRSDKASTINLPSSTSSDKPVTIASRQRPVFSSLSYSASRMTRSRVRLVEGTVHSSLSKVFQMKCKEKVTTCSIQMGRQNKAKQIVLINQGSIQLVFKFCWL